MSPDKMEDFDVVFNVKMPGTSKKQPYTIKVRADSPGEALAIAEAKYQEITGQYDVHVIRAPAHPAADKSAETQKEG